MDEHRYEELFLEEARCVRQARRLKFVGDSFTSHVIASLEPVLHDRKGFVNQSAEYREAVERFRALADGRALHYGLAIENSVKARQIRSGLITVENGKPRGLRTDHKILEQVQQVGYVPDGEEREFLALLAYQTETLTKYPIAKSLDKQLDFTGRSVGSRPAEAEWLHRIIVGVLQDQNLIEIYEHGHRAR